MDAEIHWVTRSEFVELVKLNKNVNKVIGLDRKLGTGGLIDLIKNLKRENYDLIYDAHNNLRSNLIHLAFLLTFQNSRWITRSKNRIKRIFLFNFRINLFPKPFKGIDSYLFPLEKYNKSKVVSNILVDYQFPNNVQEKVNPYFSSNNKTITIVPSAAWPMKRWPLEYWKDLINLGENYHFYILGGKEDVFCEDIKSIAPNRVTNLAGQLSLIESSAFIAKSSLVVSADTGLLHVADVMGVRGISLMGPSAFGFTKSSLIKTLEVELSCRPCSKDGSGKCKQEVYQKCMREIMPQAVLDTIKSMN